MSTLNNVSKEILLLFSDNTVDLASISENFDEVKITYFLNIERFPEITIYGKILGALNPRDTFHLSVVNEGEVVENFTNRSDKEFSDYIELLEGNLTVGDYIEVIFTIEKKIIENKLSVYFKDEFIQYLNSLSFLVFLNVVEGCLNKSFLILEYQESNSNEIEFATKTISFVSKDKIFEKDSVEDELRSELIHRATSLCHWDIENSTILPEDLFPTISNSSNNALPEIFKKVCLLYTSMFIFDYVSIKEKSFSYKLNGFKTFGEQINTVKIDDVELDTSSFDLLFNIYKWIYNGGNTPDKLSIARNIISLNFDPKTLNISNTCYDAILSNHRIYERQNVRQYIEVRNKLSEILIDLQDKIDKIVNSFVNDYKKNIITLLSFFISVIAIRVISKGDFIGGFTTEIIILSYSFLLISIGIMIYSRWEFSKRIEMFDKHYIQLKERYKELLSSDELNKIFDDCNPKNKESRSFIHEQKRLYTILWICSVALLAISITVILFNNHSKFTFLNNEFIQFILCFTKNT